jgi:hypothetical protein
LRKLNQADMWLIEEIEKELINKYKITDEEAKKLVEKSIFMNFLFEKPIFTHHEGIEHWVKFIFKNDQL